MAPRRRVLRTERVPSVAPSVAVVFGGNADSVPFSRQVGDIVKVTRMNINGQWEGEVNGRKGLFPFTHVKIIDPQNPDESE